MQAEIIALANRVVSDLNAGDFCLPFAAAVCLLPEHELVDDLVRVSVVPRSDKGTPASRSSSQHEYGIDIGVIKKVDASLPQDELDPLFLLAQQIADCFAFGGRADSTVIMASSTAVLYDVERLRSTKEFLALVSLSFRGWREPA